jgi:hypothetical protein
MAEFKLKMIHPDMPFQMITVATLIDELQRSNNVGKAADNGCLLEYKDEIWKLEKIKI